jgi:hypothetical protein
MTSVFSYEVRALFAGTFYIVAGWIAVVRSNADKLKIITVGCTTIFYVFFQLNSWKVLSPSLDQLLYNPLIILILTSFLIINWNSRLLKVFFITALAHYLLEYPSQIF